MEEVIIKWKINREVLASKMKMPSGTFNNKMNPKHSAKFTQGELWNLREILIEMMKDLDTATNIEFNDALKVFVEAK